MKRFAVVVFLAGFMAGCHSSQHASPVAPSQVADQQAPVEQPPAPKPPAPKPPPPKKVYPSNGPAVIRYVAKKYPERLKAGVSRATRIKNMKFLRDRVIEVGKCGGMDLGWNLKRGGPDISIDFITERRHGKVYGHDIAIDYDNPKHKLRLVWGGGKYPKYKNFGKPRCD